MPQAVVAMLVPVAPMTRPNNNPLLTELLRRVELFERSKKQTAKALENLEAAEKNQRRAETLMLSGIRTAITDGGFDHILREDAGLYARLLAVYQHEASKRAEQASSLRRKIMRMISVVGIGLIAAINYLPDLTATL
jgi:hypothetical protein